MGVGQLFESMTEKRTKSKGVNNQFWIILIIILWLLTAWLLYPLIVLDSVDMENAKQYLYRSAFGITIMIIFFGKTLVDLIYSQVSSRKMSLLNTVLLSIYSLGLVGGIIFMFVRMAILYLRSGKTGFLF
jgi:TRAP-type mannitol/chloroaromatic compound transport system permease small subunit